MLNHRELGFVPKQNRPPSRPINFQCFASYDVKYSSDSAWRIRGVLPTSSGCDACARISGRQLGVCVLPTSVTLAAALSAPPPRGSAGVFRLPAVICGGLVSALREAPTAEVTLMSAISGVGSAREADAAECGRPHLCSISRNGRPSAPSSF